MVLLVVAIILLVGGYIYLNNQKQMTQTNPKMEQKQELITPQSTETKEFTMTARQWAFEPSEIKVRTGDAVRLKVKSVDVAHGFGLPDFNIDTRLEPGKETTVEFVANKKGTFTFFCSVFCGQGHKDMKGTLVVE